MKTNSRQESHEIDQHNAKVMRANAALKQLQACAKQDPQALAEGITEIANERDRLKAVNAELVVALEELYKAGQGQRTIAPYGATVGRAYAKARVAIAKSQQR